MDDFYRLFKAVALSFIMLWVLYYSVGEFYWNFNLQRNGHDAMMQIVSVDSRGIDYKHNGKEYRRRSGYGKYARLSKDEQDAYMKQEYDHVRYIEGEYYVSLAGIGSPQWLCFIFIFFVVIPMIPTYYAIVSLKKECLYAYSVFVSVK